MVAKDFIVSSLRMIMNFFIDQNLLKLWSITVEELTALINDFYDKE